MTNRLRNGLAFVSAVALLFGVALDVRPAAAQQPVIAKGDAVVTGFSGSKTAAEVPADVHPLDKTFIDLDGASAQVFDLSVLGTAPRGQVSDVPAKLKIKAAETGQLFGVTLDDASPPNAYLTATSMFGLQIVDKDGNRLVTGDAGAKWMAGQFGPENNPGAIYKLDGATGKVALFATVKASDKDNAGLNSGPGLGNITFDPVSRQLFVSDLETGLIHRLSLSGEDRGVFDHGEDGRTAQGLEALPFDPSRRMDITSASFNSEDPATWGYADARRRVFGLAVSKNRIYYANAEGPSIWSVSITADGGFGDDARIELEPNGTTAASDITDILFDGAGIMILSQRGSMSGAYDYEKFAAPQQSSVLRYAYSGKEGRWLAAPDEYAIGLKTDYRATQGGVALNYGYDKFGNINYGACRQTLWTTGEHLRDGDDKAKIASGGARIVSGLQGNYKSRLRPANAPAAESWFTDYDDRHEDAQAFGHIGDVAIYAPCSPQVADSDYIPPYIPPPEAPGLTLDKVCHPGAIGGQIRCTISVRNLTGRIVSQDVKFSDLTKTMFGPGAGTIVPIVAATPLVPGIICAATPTPDFWCTMPAAILLPGEAIGVDVFIDTHDLALAGNLGFRNCAYLKHPDGYSKACAEGGTDIVVEKIGPAFCLPGNTCKFGLKIANAGLMPYNGDVLLADAMFVGGAVQNAVVTAVNPPIPCSAGDTAQLPFTCVTSLSLMPGEEHIHWVDVTMPAPGGYWAKNCFGALDPALLPLGPVPPGLGGGGVGAGNPSCVWVHVPVPEANIKLEKSALNGGLCDKVGANLHCKYEIGVTNMDAIAYNAPLTIKETVPAGATLISATAPWACAGGPPDYTCDTGAAVNIPPGGTTTFNVTVSIPVAASEATMCKVPNTAKITVPAGGAAPNLQAGDDEGDAIASTFGLFWEDPITGITFVMCDPTNLKVEKVANGDCKEAGDQYGCGYDVTVTNMGPDPYKGPVKLDETFAVAPQSVSFGGDFVCNGGGANYKCETPIVELAKGHSVTLKVNAKVPASGICELTNTATMTMPPVGSKGNGDGSDDSASATANVPSPRCDKSSVTPVPPKRCPDGKPLPRSGRCPCPNGTEWNRQTFTCDGDEPETPSCVPGRNEFKTKDGACVCRDGYERRDGRCVDLPDPPRSCKPGPHEIKTPGGRCICDDGYERNADGRCVVIEREPEGCVPGPNEFRTGNGRCVCKDGFDRNKNGVCVRGDDDATDGNPAIDCRKRGGTWTGQRCVFPPKECPGGYTGTPPNCKPIVKDPPKKCPPGTRGVYPKCIDIPKFCPPGMIGTPPNCRIKPPTITVPPKVRPPQINKPIFKPQINLQPKINNPVIKAPAFKPNFNQVPR